MKLLMKVSKVVKRTASIEERGKTPRQQSFEDVSLEPVSGDPWSQSPAGIFGFTIDNPTALGKYSEGQTVTVTLS